MGRFVWAWVGQLSVGEFGALIAAALVLSSQWFTISDVLMMRGWLATQGVITSVEIHQGTRFVSERPLYVYQVGGLRYRASRTGPMFSGLPARHRYKSGQGVTVFYNPAIPANEPLDFYTLPRVFLAIHLLPFPAGGVGVFFVCQAVGEEVETLVNL